MNPTPSFVVLLGFPRSGTTLLSRLLDAHPEISCPPETHLLSAASRFLSEQTEVEGPPIGVLSGLSFVGIPADEVIAPLREMVFGFHRRIADGAPVWVEKTGSDIFHLETIEMLLRGQARFLTLIRNPLDVIASNLDLEAEMGAQLSDLATATAGHPDRFEGLARAWVDRAAALDAFAARQADGVVYRLRYEDLLADPAPVLSGVLDWLGVADTDGARLAETALGIEPRIGLGDFRVNTTAAIRQPQPDSWRRRLPRAAQARIVPVLAAAMQAQGYAVPKVPTLPSREDRARQFAMAARLKWNSARAGG